MKSKDQILLEQSYQKVLKEEESEQLQFRREKGYKPYTGDGKKPDTYLANHLVDQIASANFSPSLLRSVLGQVGNMLIRVDKGALEEYCRDTLAVLEEDGLENR